MARAFGDTVEGTNCGNCKFLGKRAARQRTNDQGGTFAPDKKHLGMAEDVDLVTLPGDDEPKLFAKCDHDEVDQVVTDRMCCAEWDNQGALREWKK